MHTNKVQTLMNENVKDVTLALGAIKDNLYARIGQLEAAL